MTYRTLFATAFLSLLVQMVVGMYVPIIWVIYFLPLYVVAIISSLWLLVFTKRRLPIRELADYRVTPFRREIQHDMGVLTQWFGKLGSQPALPRIRPLLHRPSLIFDIGSGDGVSSVHYRDMLFNDSVPLWLSDAEPNLIAWGGLRITNHNLHYIEKPMYGLDESRLDRIKLTRDVLVQSVNSLHHLSSSEVQNLFAACATHRMPLLIIDARRLHFLQPLLVPSFFHALYVVLALFGSSSKFHQDSLVRRLLNVVIEPWIMCIDQCLGSARRYDLSTVMSYAEKYGYIVVCDAHSIMNFMYAYPKNQSGNSSS